MIAICFANFEFADLAWPANAQASVVCRKISYNSNCSNTEHVD